LMIGAALGESMARLAHMTGETQALWALMGMGAMLSGALGVPLTAILFSIELTHALPALLPLACTASYLVTSLVMPRSILTEKLSRRGYHLSREYGVDPLEMISVAQVMTDRSTADENRNVENAPEKLPEVLAYSDETCRAVAEEMATTGVTTMPVVDRSTGLICGSVSAQDLLVGRRRAVVRESERNSFFQRD
jgi:CIC family chloride channel protein